MKYVFKCTNYKSIHYMGIDYDCECWPTGNYEVTYIDRQELAAIEVTRNTVKDNLDKPSLFDSIFRKSKYRVWTEEETVFLHAEHIRCEAYRNEDDCFKLDEELK